MKRAIGSASVSFGILAMGFAILMLTMASKEAAELSPQDFYVGILGIGVAGILVGLFILTCETSTGTGNFDEEMPRPKSDPLEHAGPGENVRIRRIERKLEKRQLNGVRVVINKPRHAERLLIASRDRIGGRPR
ncbi:MAG: hypothetical protein V1489_01545 [Candidatus Liptonbacteria bacterium]